MIHAVLVFNNSGKPRLTKFYSPSSASVRSRLVQQLYLLVSCRPDSVCNFVEVPEGEVADWVGTNGGEGGWGNGIGNGNGNGKGKGREEGNGMGLGRLKVVYRHYATLYFAFVVDEAESELGILDLIQVFVEALDRCFANVCELDLVFNYDQVHLLLSQIIVGGLVLDTSVDSVAASFRAQVKAAKSSAKTGSALGGFEGIGSATGLGGMSSMNLRATAAGWRPFGR